MTTCKLCYSEIDNRAKKCPYCQHWQSKIRSVIFNPILSVILVLIIFLAGSWFLESIFTPNNDFSEYKNLISIAGSNIEFGENSCGETVSIIGKVKNNTEIDWKNVNFEVIFYDDNDSISDTDQIEKYSFLLPGNEEMPFKLSMKKEFASEKYNRYEVRILSAREKLPFFE